MAENITLTDEQFERFMESQRRSQGNIDRSLSEAGNMGGNRSPNTTQFGGGARDFFDEKFAQAVRIPQATLDFVQNVQNFSDPDGPIPQLLRLQEEMGGLAGEMGNQLEAGTSITNNYAQVLDDLNKKLLGGASSVDGMGISLSNLLGDMPEAMKIFDRLATGADSSANSFKLLNDRTSEDLSNMALEMGVFGDRMGLSTSETAAIVEREMSRTGEAGTNILRDAAIASARVADQIGDSSKEIMNITATLIADTQRYGNVSTQEAARIGASLRQLGLDYGELNSMVDKFFNFDSSVQSVSALTSVFGVQLDAMEMMMMANEDQGAMLEYVREQFLATGKSVDEMGLAEKRLVQQQLGLSDIQAVERLFDPTADLTAMDELGTDTELKAGDIQESMEELSTEIRRFGGNTQKAMDRMAEQSFRAALANQQMTLAKSTSLLQEFFTDVEKSAIAGADVIAETAGVGNVFGSMEEAMKSFTKELKEGIAEAFKEIPQMFADAMLEAAEKAGVVRRSPSKFGLMVSGGIIDAFDEIPGSFHDIMNDASSEGMKAFDKMLSDSDSPLAKWGQEIGKLGMTIEDFSREEIQELTQGFNISQENLAKVLNRFSENTGARDLAQKFENELEIAAKTFGAGSDAFKEDAARIAEVMGLSDDVLAAGLADYNKDSMVDPSGGGYQDATFQALLAEQKKQAAEAEAEAQAAPDVENTSSQEATASAREQVRATDASTARMSALTEEVKLLRDALAETRENQSIAVKIIADPIVLNLMDDGTAKQIATAAIKGTQLDARGGTNDARIQLTTVETP